jgi:uncharacterized protein YdaT
MKRPLHVVPHDDGWAVRREHSERVSSKHDTQSDALEQAQRWAREEKVEVVIHRPDGTIRDKDSYGPDPNPPKDKKH